MNEENEVIQATAENAEEIKAACTQEAPKPDGQPGNITQEADPNPQEVGAEGEKYDFVLDKYRLGDKTEQEALVEQAKGYAEIRKKLNGFSGAPDEYEVNLPEGKEVELDKDDPYLVQAQEWAKSKNMNQETFDELIEQYIAVDEAKTQAYEEYRKAELGKMKNSEARIGAIESWVKSNIDESLHEGFDSLAMTAEGVQALEAIINRANNTISSPNPAREAKFDEAEMRRLMFEVDQYGRRIYSYDLDRQRQVEEMAARKPKG